MLTDQTYFKLATNLNGKSLLLLLLSLIIGYNTAKGQARDGSQKTAFSLKEAISYAIENNANAKNAALDIKAAQHKVKETIAYGLPQINGTGTYLNTYNVQKFVLENEPNTPFYTQQLPPGAVVAFGLQLPHSMSGSITWQQLLFDGSYLVGLQASSTYMKLAEKNYQASKITVAENVSKAYYGVLVNRERVGLLDLNILRLDSSLRELKALNKQGFVEQLDVDRLEVTRNNLLTEKEKTKRLIALSEQLLKFQMSYPQTEPITLTDNLNDKGLKDKAKLLGTTNVNYSSRIEFSVLQTQQDLARLDLKNINVGYLPKLYGQASIGSNTAANDIRNLPKSNRWFYNDQVALSLQVPIFDGFSKYHKAQQSKINIEKINNGFEQLKRGIDLQIAQANTNLVNARETMAVQERNMNLAKEVVRVAKIKFQQGVGGNLDIVTAEAQLKEAQINYYNAVYDALIAMVDQEVAAGTLLSE